jgi:hypothetical protein
MCRAFCRKGPMLAEDVWGWRCCKFSNNSKRRLHTLCKHSELSFSYANAFWSRARSQYPRNFDLDGSRSCSSPCYSQTFPSSPPHFETHHLRSHTQNSTTAYTISPAKIPQQTRASQITDFAIQGPEATKTVQPNFDVREQFRYE